MTEETDTIAAPQPAAAQPPQAPSDATAAETSGNKPLWMGAAAGIGSAALVAALLYARRKK